VCVDVKFNLRQCDILRHRMPNVARQLQQNALHVRTAFSNLTHENINNWQAASATHTTYASTHCRERTSM